VGREKANKANLEANARGGKGAAEALQARLMGLPPQTEAAQKFVGTLQNGNAAVNKLADDVNDSSKSLKDMEKSSANLSQGMAKDGENLKVVGSALVMAGKGGEAISKALGAANNATRNGIKSTEDQIAFEEKLRTETKAQKESEAKAAVETQKAVQELGQTVLAALLPAIKLLTPIMNTVVGVFGAIIKVMNEYKTVTVALAAAAAAYLVIQKTQQILSAVNAAKAAGGKGLTGGLGVLGALSGGKVGGPLGSSPDNAMWVRIAGGGASGPGGIDDLLDKAGDKNKPGSKTRGGKSGKLGGLGKTALKGAGVVGAIAGVAMLGSELKDINDQVKAGNITAEEGRKQQGGAVGETGGGLAGAGVGAAIGTMLLPGIGTVIGGLLGGAIGAYGGGAAGEAIAGPGSNPSSSAPKPKLADGGIVSKPTNILAGESGAEIISPVKYFENLQSELQTLNKQTVEMLRYLRETAEYTRSTADATKQLGGDLFKF